MAWESASVVVKLKDKELPRNYLERVGRELVRVIENRTKAGKDKNGAPFAPYSDSYKESDDFMLANKSKNNVNLKLSGEMLANLNILSASEGTIIIGFRDEEQRAKAHGHQTGANGTGKLPVRDFLGISEDELAEVLRKVPPPEKLKKAEDSLFAEALARMRLSALVGQTAQPTKEEIAKAKMEARMQLIDTYIEGSEIL